MSPWLTHLCIPDGRWVRGPEGLNSSSCFSKSSLVTFCSLVSTSPSHHLPNREDTFLKYFVGLLWGSNSKMEVKVALWKVLSTLQTILYNLNVTNHQSGSLSWSISLPHTGGEILGSPQGIGKAAWLRMMLLGLRNRRPWYETYFASNEQGKVTSPSWSKK